MNDDAWALDTFCGTARLFPLPNLVMFPHVVQPLHVFEQRYRDMTADALAGDQLIAMALLRPDWEKDYEGRPAIHPTVCLGRIVADKLLDDGRYLLLLRGLCRGRITEELPPQKLYREARLELQPDYGMPTLAEARRIRQELAALILPRFTGSGGNAQPLHELFEGETPLATLVDCLSYQLPFSQPRKQELLEEAHLGRRVELLLASLRSILPPAPSPGRPFPPDFSLN